MKKWLVPVILTIVTLLFAGCGSTRDYSEYDVAGKTFKYENDGFFGNFTVTLNDDGTFLYYEGFASSYLGIGEWSVEENRITLTDELLTNVFEIENGRLIWRAEGSDNFLYVQLEDGALFPEE